MSITPSTNATERTSTPERERTTPRPFVLQYAKRSFEPYNTNPTPAMFSDKWQANH